MAGWGSIASVAIGTAATMAIFPRVAAIFAQAFTYLASASRTFSKDKNREEIYIGVDDASGYGETSTLLPGRYSSRSSSSCASSFRQPFSARQYFGRIPFTFNVYSSLNNGNIFKSLISCTLAYIPGLILASPLFATYTQIYNGVSGLEPIAAGAFAGNSFFMGMIQNLMMRSVFSWGWVALGVLFVAFWPLWFWFKKNKVKIVDWIENKH